MGSASAITALYEGIPAISEHGAAHAPDRAAHVGCVAQPLMPSIEDRTRFPDPGGQSVYPGRIQERGHGDGWKAISEQGWFSTPGGQAIARSTNNSTAWIGCSWRRAARPCSTWAAPKA